MTEKWDPEQNEVEALAAFLPAPTSSLTLEIGCGDGRLAARLAGLSRRVIGVDPSLGKIWSGAKTGSRGPLLAAADARHLPFRDGSFSQAIFGWAL